MTAVILKAQPDSAPRFWAPPEPFQKLGGGYDLIMADPPWPTKMRSQKGEEKSSVAKYGSMSFADIADLPVAALAKPDSVLFLWVTSPMVVYGGDPDLRYIDHDAGQSRSGAIAKAWGFRVVSTLVWLKTSKNGIMVDETGRRWLDLDNGLAFGTGYNVRNCKDPIFLCMKGNPDRPGASRLRDTIIAPVREHSRKPDEAFAWCESYMPPGARLLELFSRTARPRWDTWGYEVGKFEPVVERQALGSATRGEAA